MKYYNVQPEAWAPLGGGRHKPFEKNPPPRNPDAHRSLVKKGEKKRGERMKDLGYVGESVKHFNPEFVRGCLAVKIHD